jgi:hypothetical protein
VLSQSSASKILLAMDIQEDRRTEIYASPQSYLDSFKAENNGKSKILYIGAGLAYDDLVISSSTHFLKDINLEKTRPTYFPKNAYLIDVDGIFFSYPPLSEKISSRSDYQADIAQGIGTPTGLPQMFEGQFDTIILENLDFDSITGTAFKNLYSLLKKGGKIICNIYYEVSIQNIEEIKREHKAEFAALDKNNNALLELYYPYSWALGNEESENESLLTEFTYIITPMANTEDKAYLILQSQHTEKKVNIISYEDFKHLYETEMDYKQFIKNEARAVYCDNLKNYFNILIPGAVLSFTDVEASWVNSPSPFGYFTITKN